MQGVDVGARRKEALERISSRGRVLRDLLLLLGMRRRLPRGGDDAVVASPKSMGRVVESHPKLPRIPRAPSCSSGPRAHPS